MFIGSLLDYTVFAFRMSRKKRVRCGSVKHQARNQQGFKSPHIFFFLKQSFVTPTRLSMQAHHILKSQYELYDEGNS